MLTVVVIVLVIGVGGAVALTVRHRQPTSIESGITSFRREMDALAPRQRRRPAAQNPGFSMHDHDPGAEQGDEFELEPEGSDGGDDLDATDETG